MKKLLIMTSLLVIALSSCNYPTEPAPGITVEQQAATAVAQTLTAAAEEQPVPLASPTLSVTTPAPTAAAPTIQPNATPSNVPTTLTVDANTNCRSGPGPDYPVVIILVPGSTYQMIARTVDNTYWVVTEIGKSNQCWVASEYSNAFGDVTLLPVTTPSAPTSAAGNLQAPVGLTYYFDCTAPPDIKVDLSWTDQSNNEAGFRVYRDGVPVANLPANTTFYTDIFIGSTSVIYTYRVSAYNESGEAMGNPISFSCGG